MDEISRLVERFKRYNPNVDWGEAEKVVREWEKHRAVCCRDCGGVETAFDGKREIDWREAMTRFQVAPDAWCIC